MDFLDLQNELNIKLQDARLAHKDLGPNAVNMANIEKDLKIKRATKTAELEMKGVAKTLVPTYLDGDPEIAELKRQYVIAEATYKASQDLLNLAKFEAKMINDEINREWSSGGYNNG